MDNARLMASAGEEQAFTLELGKSICGLAQCDAHGTAFL